MEKDHACMQLHYLVPSKEDKNNFNTQRVKLPFLLITSTKIVRDFVFNIASRINERCRVLRKNEERCQAEYFLFGKTINRGMQWSNKEFQYNLWDPQPPTSPSAAVTNKSFK